MVKSKSLKKEKKDNVIETSINKKNKKSNLNNKEKKSSFVNIFEFINKKNIDNKKNNNNKKYTKKKKQMKKKLIERKFSLDLFDLLIVVVLTAIISCVFTGLILNHQYRKNFNYLDENIVSDEGVKNFLETYDEIIDNFYEEVDKNEMIKAALEGMLSFLEDKYSIYLDKTETDSLSEMLDGSYEGIGIVAYGNVVFNIYKDSPAEKAGLKVNDEIIKINGTDISMENFENISSLLVNNKENEIVVKRDKEELTFKIKLEKVNVPTTTTDVIKSKDKKNDIGYLSLSSFSVHSYDDFKNSLIDLENKKIDSLIIDLRDNTGGYLKVAENISNLFLDKGKVIYSLESKDEIEKFKDITDEKRRYKIVILVNSNTASAAEILTAALHDSYGAMVVGTTTLGKGKVQTMKYYEDTMVKYTSAKWLRPNGECIDQIGITPDYEIVLKYDGNTIYDLQLDKAIELLS